MEFLDVPTILQITAAFNLLAALAWLMLAQTLRIAPRASRLMAAVHLLRLVTQDVHHAFPGWPDALRVGIAEGGLLGCHVLLLLALRRMLRSRQRSSDVACIAGGGALAVAMGLLSGAALAAELAGAATLTWLALLCRQEVRRGIGHQLRPAVTVCMTLPFAMLALMSLAHIGELLSASVADGHLLRGEWPSPLRAVSWFIVTAAITLSLMALMIWRVISRIQHLTHSDPLTGTLNRRAFELALGQAQAQLLRGHGFALVMIDIDHFKRINDQHGHAMGDAALKHCVRVWQTALREVDLLGRLGGEEFCALLPLASPADLDTAATVAERLRAGLQAQPLPCNGVTLALTASFGVALPVTGDARGEVGLARADAELYRAKAEGRNRVCVARHLQPSIP